MVADRVLALLDLFPHLVVLLGVPGVHAVNARRQRHDCVRVPLDNCAHAPARADQRQHKRRRRNDVRNRYRHPQPSFLGSS